MITKFKLFEVSDVDIKHYVVIKPNTDKYGIKYSEFISSNVARVTSIQKNYIYVVYDDERFNYNQPFYIDEIMFQSDDKKELEFLIKTYKYNL